MLLVCLFVCLSFVYSVFIGAVKLSSNEITILSCSDEEAWHCIALPHITDIITFLTPERSI